MTLPPSTPPAVPSPVLGWTSADDLYRLANRNMAFVWADGPDETTQPRFPVVIIPLALDASGQRIAPEELVERCVKAVVDRYPMEDIRADDCEDDVRAVLRAAFSLGEGR